MALDSGITRLRSAFRLGFYIPVITSIVAVAVVWRFLLQDEYGLFNTVLGWFGIDGPNWLGDPNWSMPSLILMAAWRNFGTAHDHLPGRPAGRAVVAARGGRDRRRQHAGSGSATSRCRCCAPRCCSSSVTTAIGYLQFFEEPFVMTRGGPLNSTISMSMYTYKQFGFGNYGYAAAMSYIIFVVIAMVTAIQFRLLREKT